MYFFCFLASCSCIWHFFQSGEKKVKAIIFSQEDWLPTCLQTPSNETGKTSYNNQNTDLYW